MAWIRACGGGSSPSVPDGRTVTPKNDVVVWQQCAGITNPTYTTLSEVLADVGVLSVLMASNNAVDYLVRCKDWLGGLLTPAMTSNNTPSGQCFGSSIYSSSYDFYKAFDGDSSSSAWSSAGASSSYIGYKFTEPKAIYTAEVIFKSRSSSISCTYTCKLQGSNDSTDGSNGTWTDISSTITQSASTSDVSRTISTTSTGSYQWVRLYASHSSSATLELREIRFWCTNICENANVMTYIGQNNYASNTLLADSDWCTAICNSTYFESVLNAKVPTMTSNTTPSGTASSSAIYGDNPSYMAYKAFDSNTGTQWVGKADVRTGYLQYDFGSNKKIYVSKIYKNVSNAPKTVKVQASLDGNTFTDLTSNITISASTGWQTLLTNTNPSEYRYYKLNISDSYDTQPYVNELQFYGRKDIGMDRTVYSAPNDTVYYVENGSNVTLCTTDSNGEGTANIGSLVGKTVTLYSSVAKDPSNLSNAYSKVFSITSSTQDIRLMPDNALYWWGYQNNLQTVSTANGWSEFGSRSYANPTYNTNDIYCNASNSNVYVGTATPVSFTTVCAIKKDTRAWTSGQITAPSISTRTYTNKTTNIDTDGTSYILNTLTLVTMDNTDANTIMIGAHHDGAGYIYALWYE